MSDQQKTENDQLRKAARALLDYFDNGGPDTPIRTTWLGGAECWEAPADDLRPLLLDIERALVVPPATTDGSDR